MVKISMVMGLMAILLYLYLFMSVKKHLKAERGALIHLILSMVYTLWLPLPLALVFKNDLDHLLILGGLFGGLSLVVGALVMIVQASHLSYACKHLKEETYYDQVNGWVLNGLIGSQVELYAGVLKFIWILFVTLYHLSQSAWFLAAVSAAFLLVNALYIPSLISDNLKVDWRLKTNQVIIHLETLLWYGFVLYLLV